MANEQRLFESALSAILEELNLGFSLKDEQKEALESFVLKKDVFAVLPTGYGKSLIYQLAPLVAKRMELSEMVIADSHRYITCYIDLLHGTSFSVRAGLCMANARIK